jgi:hypothetical protein
MDAAVTRFNATAGISSLTAPATPCPSGTTSEQVVRIGAQLDAARERLDWNEVCGLLDDLHNRNDIGLSVLQSTAIGHTVKRLRKVRDVPTALKARSLVASWREKVLEESSNS